MGLPSLCSWLGWMVHVHSVYNPDICGSSWKQRDLLLIFLSDTHSSVCVLLRSSENPQPWRRRRRHRGFASMLSVMYCQATLWSPAFVVLPRLCVVFVLQAALLHDTVEDTDTSPAELEAKFGPIVARIVQEVTDDKSLPKQERKRQQVEHAPHCSHQAKLVKLADKLYNLRDLNRCTPVGQHLSLTVAACLL